MCIWLGRRRHCSSFSLLSKTVFAGLIGFLRRVAPLVTRQSNRRGWARAQRPARSAARVRFVLAVFRPGPTNLRRPAKDRRQRSHRQPWPLRMDHAVAVRAQQPKVADLSFVAKFQRANGFDVMDDRCVRAAPGTSRSRIRYLATTQLSSTVEVQVRLLGRHLIGEIPEFPVVEPR